MTTHMICSHCGSLDVRADAWAEWDSAKGEWVLHSTYDAKHCETCEGEASLLEIDEATQIEISSFGMIRDGDDTSRLVQACEKPDFYDVIVRAANFDSGAAFTLHEIEDMDRKAADQAIARMVALYPLAGVTCEFGAG